MSAPKTSTTVIEPVTRTAGEPTPDTAPDSLEPKETVQTVQPKIKPQQLRPVTTVS